jgi:UDP-N-acetylglucosamine 4,6-dehydratase
MVSGSTILVTGGTGSFGTAILRRLLTMNPAEVRVYSRDEQKHYRIKQDFQDSRVTSIVGDVRDTRRLTEAVRGADVVFHAAAIKHVPIAEDHPGEAVATNILGAQNLVAALDATDFAGKLIAISTDKAVEPINVMGMTKAIQERVILAAGTGRYTASVVRYGNVLASNGSVVPFFLKCLKEGRAKLPITHQEMTRFVLTLEQAVDLVFHAVQVANPGDLFVSQIPAHRVVDMARAILILHGRDEDEWEQVGIRPGEKLHEVLLTVEEARSSLCEANATLGGAYYRVPRVKRLWLPTAGAYTSQATSLNVGELIDMVKNSGLL